MSEQKARQRRAAKARQSPAPEAPAPAGQPLTTVNDLLQLIGAKDVEIMGLQRQVAGLQQQVKALAEQYVEKREKKD